MLFQESLQQKWLFGKILFCKKDGKKVYIVKYLYVITGKVLANNFFLCEIWSESPRRRKNDNKVKMKGVLGWIRGLRA